MKFVTTSLVTVVLMLGWTQIAAPSPSGASLVVRATIWPNLIITFSPKTFRHGTVVVKVQNRDHNAHVFSLNGVTSTTIKPHTVVSMTITFKRKATYTATLTDCGYLSLCTGADAQPTGSVKVT